MSFIRYLYLALFTRFSPNEIDGIDLNEKRKRKIERVLFVKTNG